MNTFLHILKRTIVIFISLFSGAMLNGAIINISSKVIAPPKGFDLNTAEGLQAAMPHMGPEHFLFPFLAHALGTLLSALLITRFLKSQQIIFSMIGDFPEFIQFNGNTFVHYLSLVDQSRGIVKKFLFNFIFSSKYSPVKAQDEIPDSIVNERLLFLKNTAVDHIYYAIVKAPNTNTIKQ